MQHQRPGTKMTEVQACVPLVCTSTDDSRPLTGGTNLIRRRWLTTGSLQVADHACQKRLKLAHDFSVKLSPCMCSHVRLTWVDIYIYLWW